jgi:predicted nucleic acid-binding protein
VRLAPDFVSLNPGYAGPRPDLIIAATALEHGLTVVSRDTADYEKAWVPVLNPWRV